MKSLGCVGMDELNDALASAAKATGKAREAAYLSVRDRLAVHGA